LAFVWRLFGAYLAFVWRLFGVCLAFVWRLFGAYLAFVWRLFDVCWALKIFFKAIKCFEIKKLTAYSF
jgi:hypothetical protein